MTFFISELVESSGQCEWELVSVVDNTQRGSVERMVEKMRCMTELKVQPTSESEMTRMERQELEAERDRARAEKQEAEDRVREMEGRVREMEGERDRAREEKQAAEYRVREMEDIVGQMEGAMEGERDRMREMEGRVREMEGERDGVREELQQALAREHKKLVVQEQAITAEQRGPSWEVGEDELEVMDEELGCGGWAKVKVAKLKVAAKVLHDQLIYDYHRRLFRREMDVAARVSHPNLLRFLGARLEGGMAILTEFMPTSLRALVNRRPRQLLPLEHILSIATDVACALNYLHNFSPDPIVHRDISSANVLLQPTSAGGWLAKLSDYGTANFYSQLKTQNPGNPVYTAPESSTPKEQTTKMDIYSFGVLLIEMCTCKFPVPERHVELIDSIDHPGLVSLIVRCLNEDKNRRPTAAQVVDILQSMQQGR